MNRARGTKCSVVVALVAVLAVAGAARATEADASWDQSRATELALAFEKAARDLEKTARLEQVDQTGARTRTFLIVEDLKSLTRLSKRLASALGAGEGRDESQRLFSRMVRLVKSLREATPHSILLENSGDEIAHARGLLDELAVLYGVTLPPPLPQVTAPKKD